MSDTPCAEWASELQRALADLRQLERENAALKADKERMDWLEFYIHWLDLGDSIKSLDNVTHVYTRRIEATRAAIDAARKEQP